MRNDFYFSKSKVIENVNGRQISLVLRIEEKGEIFIEDKRICKSN